MATSALRLAPFLGATWRVLTTDRERATLKRAAFGWGWELGEKRREEEEGWEVGGGRKEAHSHSYPFLKGQKATSLSSSCSGSLMRKVETFLDV